MASIYPASGKNLRVGFDQAQSNPIRFKTDLMKSYLPHSGHFLKDREDIALLLENVRAICSNSDPYAAVQGLRWVICNVTEKTSLFRLAHYPVLSKPLDNWIAEIDLYSMRDAVQWWRYWHRSLEGHYWKHLYVAFSIVPEDMIVPPNDLLNGDFCLLGHSISEIWEGMRQEHVHPDSIAFMEMCLLRQYIIQYLAKQQPDITSNSFLSPVFKDNWEKVMANTHGVTVALLAANNAGPNGIINMAKNMTFLMDTLSMNSREDSLAIDMDIPTSRERRHGMKNNFQEVYMRYMEYLNIQPSAPLLARYASSGAHFVPTMDGHREHVKHVRFPMSRSLRGVVNTYVKDGRSHY
ncbi:hypothetical protein N7450_007689 [Penicillium hetheringtonii]|uniref:Uncharacterized protein n=1 Tax=Penicillium hetheringtonii TaxID=911720 RepID=A0AAD6DF01_9EURO|nr:hypothetical protein N7450_007689 [Penicillium hetheringtonii]